MRKPLPNALDIDLAGGLTEEVTPHAGVALLAELGRRSGVMAAANKYLPAKKSAKGLGQDQMVEAFVLLSALGGDCMDDFEGLRRDYGLRALVGYFLPSAPTARQWLDRFHEEELVAERSQQGSFIPRESRWLAGLRAVVRHSVRAYAAAQQPGPVVTLDVDAHLVESSKQTALPTYEGFRGYQPVLVQWAETGLVLADEFRDGNVPAGKEVARVVDEAYDSLPAGAWQVQVRSDAAAYQQEVLDHWDGRGWRFAVSADLTPQLRTEILALPPQAWQVWAEEPGGFVREWAEVPFVPTPGEPPWAPASLGTPVLVQRHQAHSQLALEEDDWLALGRPQRYSQRPSGELDALGVSQEPPRQLRLAVRGIRPKLHALQALAPELVAIALGFAEAHGLSSVGWVGLLLACRRQQTQL